MNTLGGLTWTTKVFRAVNEWAEKAIEYAPQLALYREAMEKAAHQQVIATMIHVPVLGVLLKLNIGK